MPVRPLASTQSFSFVAARRPTMPAGPNRAWRSTTKGIALILGRWRSASGRGLAGGPAARSWTPRARRSTTQRLTGTPNVGADAMTCQPRSSSIGPW